MSKIKYFHTPFKSENWCMPMDSLGGHDQFFLQMDFESLKGDYWPLMASQESLSSGFRFEMKVFESLTSTSSSVSTIQHAVHIFLATPPPVHCLLYCTQSECLSLSQKQNRHSELLLDLAVAGSIKC